MIGIKSEKMRKKIKGIVLVLLIVIFFYGCNESIKMEPSVVTFDNNYVVELPQKDTVLNCPENLEAIILNHQFSGLPLIDGSNIFDCYIKKYSKEEMLEHLKIEETFDPKRIANDPNKIAKYTPLNEKGMLKIYAYLALRMDTSNYELLKKVTFKKGYSIVFYIQGNYSGSYDPYLIEDFISMMPPLAPITHENKIK
jgi:hypothetical protein